MEPIITFEHVSKSYGDREVLHDFSLTVEKGEFVTIVGTSGGGKTTVLKLVNGLLLPSTGSIHVMGQDLRAVDLIQLRRNIGYAIQGSVLFPHMTVEENIAYVPHLIDKHDKVGARAAIEKWMKIVGLDDDLLARYPDELSGGQQQRVGIARALAASPELLLMDEPFGAVDAITRASLQQELARIHRETGITVLFVTHDINEALRLGTRVLVMAEGKLQQDATPEELLRAPATDFVHQLVASAQLMTTSK